MLSVQEDMLRRMLKWIVLSVILIVSVFLLQ